jgi:primosomal protein N' (replication factor Y)
VRISEVRHHESNQPRASDSEPARQRRGNEIQPSGRFALPAGQVAVTITNLLVTGEKEEVVSQEAARLADWCQALIDRAGLGLTVLGPASAALARIKERWRWHVIVRGAPEEIGKFVRYAAPRVGKGRREVRVVVDRDPVSLL